MRHFTLYMCLCTYIQLCISEICFDILNLKSSFVFADKRYNWVKNTTLIEKLYIEVNHLKVTNILKEGVLLHSNDYFIW